MVFFAQLLRTKANLMKKKRDNKRRDSINNATSSLAEVNLTEMAKAFSSFDKKGGQSIATENLGRVMRTLGENPSENEILRIKNEVDILDGHDMQFTDFVRAMDIQCGKIDLEDDIRQAFRIFDSDGDGSISVSELRHVMTTLGDKLSEEEADELLRSVDMNGDGVINFQEFTKMILS